jgi:predicted HTH transcriptional regulator
VEGTETPYASYGKYYMRSADEDRELSPEQLRVLMLKKEEIDSISRTESVKQNLTFAQLRTVFAARGLTVNDEHFEENTGLKLANGRYNYMANLLADENDVSIKVVTFAGKDKSEVLKRNEYGYKCLLLAMDQVLNYMESINETKVQIGTHQRQEEKLFNMLCFREAWINACLHTKWEKMNPPAVYIFSDRIEVISTGGLPGDLTKEEFYRGISRPVNIKLQKIFGQLGYVEQTGHGVPLIINHYGKQAFDVMDHYVNVIIPLNKKNYEENMPVIDRKLMLNPSQNRVYTIIKENPTYTIKTLVGETSFSDGYVRKILQYLKQNHYIERVGANKDGYWKVNE